MDKTTIIRRVVFSPKKGIYFTKHEAFKKTNSFYFKEPVGLNGIKQLRKTKVGVVDSLLNIGIQPRQTNFSFYCFCEEKDFEKACNNLLRVAFDKFNGLTEQYEQLKKYMMEV
jgi:hypothetical protein